ncbi:MAG: Smr/MutS family protein, partial [Myxococcota bacterium]
TGRAPSVARPDRPKAKGGQGVPPPVAVEAAPPAAPLTDEELFARALAELPKGGETILKKYDRTDDRTSASSSPVKRPQLSDQALFLQAVGDMTKEDVGRHKPRAAGRPSAADARFARRVQRGEVEPANTLDLHGDDRTRALERTRVFIEAEARARTEVVLVVHGKGQGILSSEVWRLLDEHPLVIEHLSAPRHLGGDGARVVRLRHTPPR